MANDKSRKEWDDTSEHHGGFVSILDHIAQFEREQEQIAAAEKARRSVGLMSEVVGPEHPLYQVFRDVERLNGDLPKEEPWETPEPPVEMPQSAGWAERPSASGGKFGGINSYEEKMLSLNPVGWWRLDDEYGFDFATARDSSGHNRHGFYFNSPQMQVPGATADGDTAVKFESNGYVAVPSYAQFSLARGNDNFHRDGEDPPWCSSWGTADSGQQWWAQVSTGEYYRCVEEDIPYDKETSATDPVYLNRGYAQINASECEGTWQQNLDLTIKDCDIQVHARWDVHPGAGAGRPLKPVGIVARWQDDDNYYIAELQEELEPNDQHFVFLQLYRKQGGTFFDLGRAHVGYHTDLDEWWFVRFKLDGDVLRARAWKMMGNEVADTSKQPTEWTIEHVESIHKIDASGFVGIRSSNSNSAGYPIVSIKTFWVQSLGMTVQVFMRPDDLNFTGGEGTGDYVMWLGKGEGSGEDGRQEWGFRFYPSSANYDENKEMVSMSGAEDDRTNRVSAYIFNLLGAHGAGAYSQGNRKGNPGPLLVEGQDTPGIARKSPPPT